MTKLPDITLDPSFALPPGTDERRELAYMYWAFDPQHRVRDVARKMGVHRTTIEHWMRDGEWRRRYVKDHGQNLAMLQQYNALRLQEQHSDMLQVLYEMAKNPAVANRDRILAAKAFADQAAPGHIEVTGAVSGFSETVVRLLGGADRSDQERILKASIEQNMVDAEDSNPVHRAKMLGAGDGGAK